MTFVLNFPYVTPNWVEVLTALAAPVAVLIAIATLWWQWILLERQLKQQMFEKRFAIYSKVRAFLGEITKTLRVDDINTCFQFLYDTKEAEFLFEAPVEEFIKQIYQKATSLHAVNVVLDGAEAHQRGQQVRKQQELEKWLSEDAHTLASKTFAPYLVLYQRGFWKTICRVT